METGLGKTRIITELTRSPHGDLKQFLPVGSAAAKQESEFFAHLIAWNQKNGQIRDSKVALPVISLSEPAFNSELAENSFAHLALLDPRNLVRAVRFAKEIKTAGQGRKLTRLIEAYLRAREANRGWWDRTVVQHRVSVKTLYALCHLKPSKIANEILFEGKYPKESIFEAVKNLKNMTAQEAAGTIMERKIPFLIAVGALGQRAKETDLVLALIERMSPTELVTNTKMLERLGVKTSPALRAAYEDGLKRAAESTKTTFKATRAVEAVEDKSLKEKLKATQEKQIKKLGGIDGNWLVLGDKSGSMQTAIDTARMIAATLAKMVKGEVHLIFFDTMPRYINATGKTYDDLLAETKRVDANGGTSIGCGVRYIFEKDINVDGIAIVSDGGENNPPAFADMYRRYSEAIQKEPPVYLYVLPGEANVLGPLMERAGIEFQEFDLRKGIDYYALPNLVQTMNARRYGLVDQIMDAPLLKVKDVLKGEKSCWSN